MKNNRFLKYKESNNRFQFLDNTNTNNISNIQKDKVISNYDTTTNVFTRSFNKRERGFNNRMEKDETRFSKMEPITIDFSNEFPELVSQPSKTNFKDAVKNQIIPEIVDETKIIKPGWVKLSMLKSKNIILKEQGPLTKTQIALKRQEELDNDINYCINQEIEKMKHRWNKYKEEYDELNGEGAYDEKYKLGLDYGSEYDTDKEYEEEYEEEYDEYDEYDIDKELHP